MKGWRKAGGERADIRERISFVDHSSCAAGMGVGEWIEVWRGAKEKRRGEREGKREGRGWEWWTVGLSHQGCLLTCATKRGIHHTGRRRWFTQLHRHGNTLASCWAHTYRGHSDHSRGLLCMTSKVCYSLGCGDMFYCTIFKGKIRFHHLHQNKYIYIYCLPFFLKGFDQFATKLKIQICVWWLSCATQLIMIAALWPSPFLQRSVRSRQFSSVQQLILWLQRFLKWVYFFPQSVLLLRMSSEHQRGIEYKWWGGYMALYTTLFK